MPSALYQQINRASAAPSIEVWQDIYPQVVAQLEACRARYPDLVPCEEVVRLAAYIADEARRPQQEVLTRFQAALELSERMKGGDHPETLYILRSIGWLHNNAAQLDQAERIMREVLARSEGLAAESYGSALTDLATVLMSRAKFSEARTLLQRALDLYRGQSIAPEEGILTIRQNLALIDLRTGQFAAAEPVFAEVCPRIAALADSQSIAPAFCLMNHGATLIGLERYRDAKDPLVRAYGILSNVVGPDTGQAVTAATFAAKAASLDGDVAFAERAFDVAIAALAAGGKSLTAETAAQVRSEYAAHLLRHGRDLPTARNQLRQAEIEMGTTLNAIGEFSAQAKRTLEFARPLYLTRVAVSWELAQR